MIPNRTFKGEPLKKTKVLTKTFSPPMCKGCEKYRCEWDKNCIPKIKEIISDYPEGSTERKKWEEIIRSL